MHIMKLPKEDFKYGRIHRRKIVALELLKRNVILCHVILLNLRQTKLNKIM